MLFVSDKANLSGRERPVLKSVIGRLSRAMVYPVHTVTLENGARLGIGPMPQAIDLADLHAWKPGAVLSMSTAGEMTHLDMKSSFGTAWFHILIADFGAPDAERQALWQGVSPRLHKILDTGGGVFAHCAAGRGRSGMALMRLMVERGIDPKQALLDIRAVRPGAVETEAQRDWAAMLG